MADELDAATAIVRRHVPPTPQYSWPMLDEPTAHLERADRCVVLVFDDHLRAGDVVAA